MITLRSIGRRSVMLLTIVSVSSLIMLNAQELKSGHDSVTLQRQQKEQTEQKVPDRLRNRNQAGEESQPRLRGQTGDRASASGRQSQTARGMRPDSQPEGTTAGSPKKIQGARPDWSKAKGARPASIERPSGSRIPKGAGRPAGVRGPGRR